MDIDFLMTIIRRLQPILTNTKIILMSATLDVQKFQNFWKIGTRELENEFIYPPIIDLNLKARKYEIIERFLDDIRKIDVSPEIINPREPGISNEMYAFATQLLLLILRSRKGEKHNILIFLPGLHEIERLQEEFYANNNMSKFQQFEPDIHILHSSLSMDEQHRVFLENNNRIKIILATNIAESSITIPNVSYVIDFCLTKHLKHHKGSQMSTYVLAWASKNNCKQRAGRTGRVARGTVFRLVFKDFYYRLREHSIPEIQLAPLESIIAKIKDFNMGAPLEILADSLDPPDESSIVNAILTLKEHGGLLIKNKNASFEYHDGELTYLGEIMASLPCDIRITKLIILGYLFSILDEAIIIAAGLNFKGIFLISLNNRMENYSQKMKWSEGSGSDCLATYNAYLNWYELYRLKYFKSIDREKDWCRANGLDVKILHEMRIWIDEIKKRLHFFKIENLPHPNQPIWPPKEKILIMKIVMAGSFGISNFFMTETQIDTERDAFQMFCDLNPFKTVYCRNMDRTIVGDVYKNQLRETLIEKGVCDENSSVAISFDRSSEKVFLTFEDSGKDLGFESIQVVPEVYKALKLCKMEGKIELCVMTSQETINYAIERGYGVYEYGEFNMNYPVIEHPEHWPYPTRSTLKMRGFITYIEHCNKFYFCPLIGYNTIHSIPDNRYEKALNDIQNCLDTIEMSPLVLTDPKKLIGQLVIYRNIETNENERALITKLTIHEEHIEIHLMDSGVDIQTPIKYVKAIKNPEDAIKLKMYSPRIFECKLKEIEPACMNTYANVWSSEAFEYFHNGVFSKTVEIDIYSIVANIVIVELKTVEGENIIDWNQKLLKEGFAQECEESYASKLNHEKRMRDINTLDKPIDPKVEFAAVIDKHYIKTREIEAPNKKDCNRVINLIGPYSPLEANLRAISVDVTGYVRVDSTSINHILLNDEILSLHDKFYVAADVNLASKNQNVKIRETTSMPKIPGLSVLLALIFSPYAELRRDKDKTRYISIITGLGLDKNFGKPYFQERDAIQCVDFSLQEDDITDINRLRFHLSSLLYRDPFHKNPNLTDGQREQILKNIKETFTTIIKKKRTIRDIQIGKNHFNWKTDQEDAIHHINSIGHGAIWDYISIPPLNEMSHQMKQQLIHHVKNFENPIMKSFVGECKLCGKSMSNANDVKLHMTSKLHLLRKEQLGIK